MSATFDEYTERALAIAKEMAINGIPIFTAEPDPRGITNSGKTTGFALPYDWETTRPNKYRIDSWHPGMALCAVAGLLCDYIDIDPRNGGNDAIVSVNEAGGFPRSYGRAATPSGGTHDVIAPLGRRKTKRDGIDYQGGNADGDGRGFVFIAPTIRRSKITGEMLPYRWINEPDLDALLAYGPTDTSGSAFGKWVTEKKKGNSNRQGGDRVYIGEFHIGTEHTGVIRPGMGHNAIVSFCGYLLKKYPDISWADYEELCRTRWQEFDQSQFTWDWDECLYQIGDCWENFERGAPYVGNRGPRWTGPGVPPSSFLLSGTMPFPGVIGDCTATPFAGPIGNCTTTPFTGKRERENAA